MATVVRIQDIGIPHTKAYVEAAAGFTNGHLIRWTSSNHAPTIDEYMRNSPGLQGGGGWLGYRDWIWDAWRGVDDEFDEEAAAAYRDMNCYELRQERQVAEPHNRPVLRKFMDKKGCWTHVPMERWHKPVIDWWFQFSNHVRSLVTTFGRIGFFIGLAFLMTALFGSLFAAYMTPDSFMVLVEKVLQQNVEVAQAVFNFLQENVTVVAAAVTGAGFITLLDAFMRSWANFYEASRAKGRLVQDWKPDESIPMVRRMIYSSILQDPAYAKAASSST